LSRFQFGNQKIIHDICTPVTEIKEKTDTMAKVCQITGRKRMKGNNVAHSKLRTKRDFSLNLKNKRFWSEEEQRYITLKVSCKGMRIIEKNGLEATLRDAQKKGLINLV
jgi:large subunit ribosomal protein L28